ncbi:MAG: hypothetical protein IJ833_05150 [Lachnospiraceae bacterium]|nr:hypothetical protein [Lachnospiraceae bacterium]
MKISFQTPEMPEINRPKIDKADLAPKSAAAPAAYNAYFQPGADQGGLLIGSGVKEKGKTLTELQQEAGNIDVGIMQDYKTVLSNTMSSEDYAKMEEEGFDFSSMEPEEAVTIVDKIKAELARSGKQIVGYTDDLDLDTLTAAVGSAALAQAISDSFAQENIPLTDDNIGQVKQAWEMASSLQEPGEAGLLYMVDNSMAPEIWNFYLAQNSGAAEALGQPRYYAEDIGGYYAESASAQPMENMQAEIDKTLEKEGIAVDEEHRKLARQLLEGGIPLESESMERLSTLQEVNFPVTEEVFARSVAVALTEGREAIHADLTQTESIYDRALELAKGDWLEEGIDVGARKQLEEIRLRMTAEVNVKLLKSGFSIDTAPMEQLIEALKQAEEEVAAQYFPEDTQAVEKYRMFHETNRIVEDIPALPAQILGRPSLIETGTMEDFHAEGVALREEFRRANESYETLMTAPRRDLGDSIRKAFANVDDILDDMNLESTDENRKAVRALGYNRMEISHENIARVTEAQKLVERVVEKMTPAAVLKMIRDGQNPLASSFTELEEYFDSLPQEYQQQAESYSRFLYGLECNHDITQQERDSFIGIYRLLHQVEASDGAAIGALVNSQAELHFDNLLSAVRSGKFKSLDARISDSFGATMDVIRKGESISDQIAKGFVETTNQMMESTFVTDRTEAAFRQEQLESMREAARVEQETVAMLERARIPANVDNLLAAESLTHMPGNLYKDFREKKQRLTAEASLEETEETWDGLLESMDEKEDFQTRYEEVTKALQEETEELSLRQADTSMDVTALQMMHKQLGVLRSLAPAEEYIIPLYLEGELTQVHLTFAQGGEHKGEIDITTSLGEEPIQAQLKLEGDRVGGLLIGNTENAVTKLTQIADIFYDSLKEQGSQWEPDRLPVVNIGTKARTVSNIGTRENVRDIYRDVSLEQTTDGAGTSASEEAASNRELYRIAKVFLQAVKQQEKR